MYILGGCVFDFVILGRFEFNVYNGSRVINVLCTRVSDEYDYRVVKKLVT